MQSTPARQSTRIESLVARLTDDPWSLSLDERRELAAGFDAEQRAWSTRLPLLVEPPTPTGDFPAFLLATPPFADLGAAVGHANQRTELDTATADELQRFVDLYHGYAHRDQPSTLDHLSWSADGSVSGASHTPRRHT